MFLKRFRGATVREALAQARTELGPNAIVLSTSLQPAAGMRGWLGAREVEIAAAAERGVSDVRPGRSEGRQAAPADPLAARLSAAGFDAAFAAGVAARVSARARRQTSDAALRAALAQELSPVAAGGEPAARIEVFVGPPGAGKTTPVAKIAARARATGRARLTLVSADGFRVGAVEQLRLYADILGAPFTAARTAAQLDAAIAAAASPVLVDTAGRSPRDGAARELFDVLAGRPGVRTHLVVPAGSGPRELRRLLDLHAGARPARLVLTRVDEADVLAPLGAVLKECGLPVSWLGTGQRVPEDLRPATAGALAAALLGEQGCEETAA
jgi:flagellar biosynthesis protein FlhF